MKKITLLLALTMSVHLWSSHHCYESRTFSTISSTCNDGIKYESTYIHQHLVLLKHEGTAMKEYILVQLKSKSDHQEYQHLTNADKRYTVYYLDKMQRKKIQAEYRHYSI